ncbi:hypothetical protein DSO57_1005630 [Entomophthora muscae]|uniref:Uncharacterized protein n=1 Tax=Entomophthora muscae TaxID=34485 RepID=A0ACC2SA18_9FUNG|nr:hypothetical protein DSO57_1005630 [Entomophthora muscae]
MIAEYPQLRSPLHIPSSTATGRVLSLDHPESNSAEFSDMLESIRGSLDLMLSRKRCPRGPFRESALGSSLSEEDDDEEIRNVLSPKILTLLDDLDSCLNKLKVPEEVVKPKPEPEVNLLPRGSVPNLAIDDRGLFTQTFGRRKSNFILPSRDRQGSLASIASFSTIGSNLASSPRTSSLAHATQAGVGIAEAQLGSTQRGWLSKLYVSHPSFLARKTWKKRFFVLNGATLYRFKTSSEGSFSSETIHFTPACSVCVTDDFVGKKFVLQISDAATSSTMHLMADSSEDLSSWLTAFKEAIVRARFEHESLPPSPNANHEAYESLESRRSSSQTLPISFQNSDTFSIAPARLSRANSQPAVQTFPSNSAPDKFRHLSQQNSSPVTPLMSPPIGGRLGSLGRIRPSRLPSSNTSRRPSLAPLQEQEQDDSEFLKDVLSPFNQRNSTFLGLFAAKQ